MIITKINSIHSKNTLNCLKRSTSTLSSENRYRLLTLRLWEQFKDYNMLVLEFKNVVDLPKKLRPRQANFPEVVSQYFVYRILKNKLLKSVNLNVTSSSADLLINSDIVEVKAGVAGPSTLTIPKKWDSIKYFYFLDCSNWQSSGIAYLYEIDWDRLKDELKVKHDSPTDKKRRIKYSFLIHPIAL